MKSILISAQPKSVERIISGKKTLIAYKRKPQLETPFKCYIYCTKGRDTTLLNDCGQVVDYSQKIIGEFICDDIKKFNIEELNRHFTLDYFLEKAQTSYLDLIEYVKTQQSIFYGWHISDLKIYDEPKELSDFTLAFHCFNLKNVEVKKNIFDDYVLQCFDNSFCKICKYYNSDFGDCNKPAFQPVKRPPKSWLYCELEGE